jgi:CD109 antigen
MITPASTARRHLPSRFLIALAAWSVLGWLAAPALLAGDAAVLTAPRTLYAGGRSSLTVTTFDATTREPIARPVVVELTGADGASLTTLYSGATGATGLGHPSFDVPALPNGTYKIRAQVTGLGEVLELETTLSRAPGILIETDKPIYKPSQRIQGRVVLLDNGLRPLAGQVEVAFHDAKGIRLDRQTLTVDEYGAAAFALDLAKEVNFGTWKIRAKSEGAESIRDVRVEEYTLPRFELKASFPKSWALVDERLTGAVEARYFFGKDVAGRATVSAKRWVGEWQEYATATGELTGGRYPFDLPAVGFIAGTPGASGQGTVMLDITVTDSTGHEQTATEVLTITEAPVVLSLVARTQTLKPAIPADVLVQTKAPDGAPLDLEVTTTVTYYSNQGGQLGSSGARINTSGGIGTLTLTPPADVSYGELSASAALGGKSTSASLRIGGAYAPSGSFLSLARTGSDEPASAGEVVSFSAVSTHRGTVYYEVYAGGRTVLSDATESDTFSFAVTPDMAPRAKVVAYKINPDNEVAADSVSLAVTLPITVTVSAGFSADQVKPGDPVQVTVDAGTGRRTLLGLSVVDKSVLALGQSRLHLGEVFAELERRFLEPQAEVHDDGGHGGPGGPAGGAPPIADVGFGFDAPRTRGALDTLREAGLGIVASKGITIPQGGAVDFWRWAEDVAAGPPAPAPGEEQGGSAPPAVRVRQFFPETWVWEPLRLTDESGRTTLELTAPDSITGWKLAVVGTAPGTSPGIVFGEDDLTVFQDFFVDPSLPYAVTRGEIFPVKVDIFNYAESAQTVDLSLGSSSGFEITGGSRLQVDVPAGAATAVHFEIRPTGLGAFPLELTARGSTLSDAIRRALLVVPEGRPVEEVSNGVIEPGQSLPLDVSMPLDAVPGSARAYLNLSPSPVAQAMSGVSDLLGMPYGCGEQNMIFLAPDIEILKYLREIGELAPEVRAEAEYFVTVGYQRELTFQTDDGGFAAFGGAEGSLWLTAFVLSTFAGAREVRDIDEAVLARAASMLVARQKPDGSFQTDDFLIHQEMDGGLSNIYAMAAYVANALADYSYLPPGGASADVTAGLARAAGFLEASRSTVNDDAYSLSIAAVALGKVPGYGAAASATLDRLLQLAKQDGPGLHWEPYPVESTGYAAMALLAANGGVGRPEAAGAVEWLSTQRNALGGYGESTQDTVVALRALFLAARKVRRDLDVELTLLAGGSTLFSTHVDETNYDLARSFELPLDAALELRSAGSGNVGFQVVRRYNVPGDLLPPPRDMLLDVDYDASHIEVDDILDVRVTMTYTGEKARTGMVIADIGVPTGFEALRASLDILVSSQVASRVELAGRKVIIYIDGLDSGTPLAFSFQMRALYPVKAEGSISRLYEYYDPDVEAYHRQGGVIVFDPTAGQRKFRRGDSNGDRALDLADAVATLSYLFLGIAAGPQPFCEDAADANDDGALNITDPIHVLGHLFLGSPPPAAPYPEEGVDATADSLRC